MLGLPQVQLARGTWTSTKYRRQQAVTAGHIRRLGVAAVLEGHRGCVNRICWNEEGTLLASVSDDCMLRLWSYPECKPVATIRSGHRNNMFGVRFLPQTNNQYVVTGAMDCCVILHSLEHENRSRYNVHDDRVKCVEVEPDNPFMFWSASEDGTIRQFDRRVPESGRGHSVLIHLNNGLQFKHVAINKVHPQYMVTGCSDEFVRVFDRRKLNGATPAAQYAPFHRIVTHDDEIHCTFVEFGRDGRSIIASYHEDHIYTWDLLAASSHAEPTLVAPRPSVTPPTPTGVGASAGIGAEAVDVEHVHIGVDSASASSVEWPVVVVGNMVPTVASLSFAEQSRLLAANFVDTTAMQGDSEEAEVAAACEKLLAQGRSARGFEYISGKTAIELAEAGHRHFAALAVRDSRPNASADFAYRCTVHASNAVAAGGAAIMPRVRLVEALQLRKWAGDLSYALSVCESLVRQAGWNQRLVELHVHLLLTLHAPTAHVAAMQALRQFPESTQLYDDLDASRDAPGTSTARTAAIQAALETTRYQVTGHFCGAANCQTDIKEAMFWGPNDQFIVAGSDDGCFYTWDRLTQRLIGVARADTSIVNGVQPHPFLPVLASCGIDNEIRIWSPMQQPSRVSIPSVALSEAICADQDLLDCRIVQNSGGARTSGGAGGPRGVPIMQLLWNAVMQQAQETGAAPDTATLLEQLISMGLVRRRDEDDSDNEADEDAAGSSSSDSDDADA